MLVTLFDGIIQGLQFALLGVGITLIYGLGNVLNLAHGAFAIIGGLTTSVLIVGGTPVLVAVFGGIASAGAIGLLMDRTLLRPAYRQRGEARVLLSLVITLGFSFVVDGLVNYFIPEQSLMLEVRPVFVDVLGERIRVAPLVSAVIAIAVFAVLGAILKWTLMGKTVRAIIENEVGAELCGINISGYRMLIVVTATTMAAIAGVTQGLMSTLGPEMGADFTIFGLLVAVIGGVRSIGGTFGTGILLGIVNAFASRYIGTYISLIILLAVTMATIFLRPHGLLARAR